MQPEISYHYRSEFHCPCGQGLYAREWTDNDWGQIKSERYTMHCPECKDKYIWDATILGGDPWSGYYLRGWVLRSDAEREAEYRAKLEQHQEDVIAKVEASCRQSWRDRFRDCKSKKAVWSILGRDFAGSYGTFLKHYRGDLRAVVQHVSAMPFTYHRLPLILRICGVSEMLDRLAAGRPAAPKSIPATVRKTLERGLKPARAHR